jgi:hypothetical protein
MSEVKLYTLKKNIWTQCWPVEPKSTGVCTAW